MRNIFRRFTHLREDSLYRNSFWLMLGTFSMSGIGFFYWIIAAKLYTPGQIGLATTFLSAISLVNGFALLGFGPTLIRFLPNSSVKENIINTAFTIVSFAALIIGGIYLLGLPVWTAKLSFIRSSPSVILVLIAFFPIYTINGITDTVFTAYRETKWVFVSNISQSLVKLFAIVLLSSFGFWGLIGSNIVSTVFAVVLCLVLISIRYNIHFRPTFDKKILSNVTKYTFGNYLSSLISTLPGMVLPIIITNRISPQQTAYYYMPTMIATTLLAIPRSFATSYFAEGSHTVEKLRVDFFRSLKSLYTLLVPAVLVIVFLGKYILLFFGKDYSSEGIVYLQLLSIGLLVGAPNTLFSAILNVKKKSKTIVAISIFSTILTISIYYIFLNDSLIGLGIASILIQFVLLLIYIVITLRS